jgi:hypothetical protein
MDELMTANDQGNLPCEPNCGVFELFPVELHVLIFSWLSDVADIKNVSLICKQSRTLLLENTKTLKGSVHLNYAEKFTKLETIERLVIPLPQISDKMGKINIRTIYTSSRELFSFSTFEKFQSNLLYFEAISHDGNQVKRRNNFSRRIIDRVSDIIMSNKIGLKCATESVRIRSKKTIGGKNPCFDNLGINVKKLEVFGPDILSIHLFERTKSSSLMKRGKRQSVDWKLGITYIDLSPSTKFSTDEGILLALANIINR